MQASLGVDPGQLDPDFGTMTLDAHTDGDSVLIQFLQQADGKLLAIGARSLNTWTAARYLADGTPDESFGSEGYFNIPLTSEPTSLAADSQGRLIIHHAHLGISLKRYLESDELDLTFGSDGALTLNEPPHTKAGEILLDSLERLYVATRTTTDLTLYRLTVDGVLDSTFGDSGSSSILSGAASSGVRFHAMALQQDGAMVIAYGQAMGLENSAIHVVRVDAQGNLDTAFGANGTAAVSIPGLYLTPQTVTFHEGGKILVGADAIIAASFREDSGRPTFDFDNVLFRFTTNGELDTPFGNCGVAQGITGSGVVSSSRIRVQANSKILIAGIRHPSASSLPYAVLRRLLPNGQEDIAWGPNGERHFTTDLLDSDDTRLDALFSYPVFCETLPSGKVLFAMTDRHDDVSGRDHVLKRPETSFQPGPETLEAWRLQHFGTTENVGAAANTADHDLDGLPNLVEFATHRDPVAADSIIEAVKAGDVFEWRYLCTSQAADEVTLTIEWPHDITQPAWTATSAPQEEVFVHDNLMTEMRATVTTDETRCFFRLRVDLPED